MEADFQPVHVGTEAENLELKLIAGTPEGKMVLADQVPERYSKLDKGEMNAGVDNLHIRLMDYPQRERFEADLFRIFYTAYGIDPAKEVTEEQVKEVWEHLISGAHFNVPGVLQFASVAFELSGVSRSFTHQLVRTRIAAYMQQGSRTCYLGPNFNVREPHSVASNPTAHEEAKKLVLHARATYRRLCEMGIPLEDARYFVPIGMETYIIVRYPLNIFYHVYAQRACPLMEWQICYVVRKMRDLLGQVWPELTRFCRIPCEFTKKCAGYIGKEHRGAKLCDKPWAGKTG